MELMVYAPFLDIKMIKLHPAIRVQSRERLASQAAVEYAITYIISILLQSWCWKLTFTCQTDLHMSN